MPLADFSSYHQPAGSDADGDKFDNFIDAVQAIINALDHNNLSPSAALPPSLFAQASAADGDCLVWNGATSQWVSATTRKMLPAAISGYPSDSSKFLRGDGTWASPSATGQKYAYVGLPTVSNGAQATTWPTANAAILVPFTVQTAQTIAGIIVVNGAANSGNFDVGVYDSSGTRKVSKGSTAQSTLTTSVAALVSITSTPLPAGQYYLALAADNTTGSFYLGGNFDGARLTQLQVGSSFPLPASLTPGSTSPSVTLPLSAPLT